MFKDWSYCQQGLFIQGRIYVWAFLAHKPSIYNDPTDISVSFPKTYLNLTFLRLLCFQTQNSIKNKHCWGHQEPDEGPGVVGSNSPLEKQLPEKLNNHRRPKGKGGKNEIRNFPKCSISPIDHWPSVRCQFWLQREHTNSQWSHYAVSALIVNSVNEVNLINFRTGSHMTFSSIFLLTSKTSISSPKIGRKEWRCLITSTIWSQG